MDLSSLKNVKIGELSIELYSILSDTNLNGLWEFGEMIWGQCCPKQFAPLTEQDK
jgi:hypothetical protein